MPVFSITLNMTWITYKTYQTAFNFEWPVSWKYSRSFPRRSMPFNLSLAMSLASFCISFVGLSMLDGSNSITCLRESWLNENSRKFASYAKQNKRYKPFFVGKLVQDILFQPTDHHSFLHEYLQFRHMWWSGKIVTKASLFSIAIPHSKINIAVIKKRNEEKTR